MLSNLQKKEFIKTICENYLDETKNEEFQIEKIKMLLADTNGGKMYKYRAVTPNSLSNLKNGTLYCAAPSYFNDPFDCKMGLDYTSLLNDLFGYYFKDIDKYLIKFLKLYYDEIFPDIDNQKEKVVFEKWFANKMICNFLDKFCWRGMTDEEIAETLILNINIVCEFMKEYMSDDEFADTIEQSQKDIAIWGKLDSNQLMISDGFTMIDLMRSCGIDEESDEIRMFNAFCQAHQPHQINNAKMLDAAFVNFYQDFTKLIDNLYRVGSLCTDYKNRLMWSHYGDNHRGFCIEYDFSQSWEITKELLCLPIVYSTKRIKIPWKAAFPNNIDDIVIQKETVEKIFFSLLTKDEIWSYENEWRIILSNSLGIENVKMPPITCIYLGALCSNKDKETLLEIANELKIPVKQMVIDRGEYRLHAQECVWGNV